MPDEESVSSTHIRYYILSAIAGSVVVGAALVGWLLVHGLHSSPNPFTADTKSSVKFALYYPTKLPNGYRIDRNSVKQPDTGVVVVTLVGPKGGKIYMSEEARPDKFDFGGYYNQFKDVQFTGVSDGSIAAGKLQNGHTKVASRATASTWILCNTNADVTPAQLTELLKSLSSS